MYKRYQNQIDPKLVDEINAAIDASYKTETFDILMPPESEDLLGPFKERLRKECDAIEFKEKTFMVLRMVSSKGNKASQAFHFDNYKKTTLVVLKSSEGENNGDLLVRDELRRFPTNIVSYMFTKLFWTNPISWFFLRLKPIRDRFFKRVELKGGDVFDFDGTTVFHGNLPVENGLRRTILIHNEPMFENSFITKLFHKLNKLYLYKK